MNINLAVQIDPIILLVDLEFESANGMFARSICTSLDQSELKISITVTYLCDVWRVLPKKQ